MSRPVRLRMRRVKGFDLQQHSLATNGLPAVLVTRGTKWGNRHDWRGWRENFPPEIMEWEGVVLRDQWCRERAVEAYKDDWTEGLMDHLRPALIELRGRNLVCWCDGPPGSCHADVLLSLAVARTCEPVP